MIILICFYGCAVFAILFLFLSFFNDVIEHKIILVFFIIFGLSLFLFYQKIEIKMLIDYIYVKNGYTAISEEEARKINSKIIENIKYSSFFPMTKEIGGLEFLEKRGIK